MSLQGSYLRIVKFIMQKLSVRIPCVSIDIHVIEFGANYALQMAAHEFKPQLTKARE